jgi:hypothetical protein
VARRLSDIENEIKLKEGEFALYLNRILSKDVVSFLFELSKAGSLYLFSGIIRNYFLGINEVRDVDLMIESSEDINSIISKYQYRLNSYGGYKIYINDMVVDLWHLRDTWALHNAQMVMDVELERYIPNTAFFNFSSILYSFKDQTFIYSKFFLRFLRDKKIDYVFKPNANYALCVVNSFYYEEKLKLALADNLKHYLVKLNKQYSKDYETVQLKHFGRIVYSNDEIQRHIDKISENKAIKDSRL